MQSIFEGCLTKMTAQLHEPVDYQLGDLSLNALLGKSIALQFLGEIYCIQCQRKTAQSFQSGFCFPCFKRLNECGLCMIHPERCRYPEGICNSEDWVHASCALPHVVYLANTTHVKVGVTRKTQVPTRWIDQGAVQAIPIFETTHRALAGKMEVWLKQFFPDKTPWQAMLKNQVQQQDLIAVRDQFFLEKGDEIFQIIEVLDKAGITVSTEQKVTQIIYPVMQYPTVVKAFNFDKNNVVTGRLLGIKGQYLLLDSGVLNIRKFGGYRVQLRGRTEITFASGLDKEINR